MNKKIKRLVSLLMCVTLAFLSAFSASALGLNAGLTSLQKTFSRDRGSSVNSFSIDYSYFDPSKGEDDENKYPLFIIMAGALEGSYEGRELTANEFGLWASDEYQGSVYGADGMYILIARAPEERFYTWDSERLTAPLKTAIDEFLQKHKNVDVNRIYAMGWCLGAKGVVNLATAYPGFLSAAVIMVPPFVITSKQAKSMAELPVWLMGSKNDSYAVYSKYIEPSWNELKANAANPSQKLLTSYATAQNTTFFTGHNVWLAVSHNFNFSGLKQYSEMKTVNASGKEITPALGFINFFTRIGFKINFVPDDGEDSGNCDCLCHSKNKFIKVIWALFERIKMIITGKNDRLCKCGKAHWAEG